MIKLFSIHHYERVDSTQSTLKEIVSSQADGSEGLVVHADQQVSGRGRGGREWQSVDGNLFFSVCLCPKIKVKEVGQIAVLAGLAVLTACMQYIEKDCNPILKWPNDIYINGKKLSGILIESDGIDGGIVGNLYIGIGINVLATPHQDFTALHEYSENSLKVSEILKSILDRLKYYYVQLRNEGFAKIRREYLNYTLREGQPISLKTADTIKSGQFVSVDHFGNLEMRDINNTLLTISSGDVFLRDNLYAACN